MNKTTAENKSFVSNIDFQDTKLEIIIKNLKRQSLRKVNRKERNNLKL
jgi:hypothetical protein